MTLTDEIISAMKPPETGKDTYLAVPGSRVLKLRITPAGGKSWYARYSSPVLVEGGTSKQVRFKIADFPAMNLRQALERAAEIEAALAAGQDPSLDRAQKQAGGSGELVTVGDLIDKYLATVAPTLRASTLNEKRRILENEIRPALGKVRLSGVTARMLMAPVEAKETAGKRRQAKANFSQLAAMFGLAVSRGWIERNPLAVVRLEIKTAARERVLSPEEIGRFWCGLDDTRMTADVRDILRLCLLTGGRVGEVAGMTVEELDLDGEIPVWRIPSERMKAKRPHIVVLSATAAGIVRVALERGNANGQEDAGLVFAGKLGDGVRISSVSQAMADNRATLGLDGRATPHDLRRSFSTLLYEAPDGFSSDLIERAVSHATGPAVSRVYNRAGPDAFIERLKPLVEYVESFVLRCAAEEERKRRVAEGQL